MVSNVQYVYFSLLPLQQMASVVYTEKMQD